MQRGLKNGQLRWNGRSGAVVIPTDDNLRSREFRPHEQFWQILLSSCTCPHYAVVSRKSVCATSTGISSMADRRITITERDESGAVATTFIASGKDMRRIDIIRPRNTKSLWQMGFDVFLPAGFPHSVTDDYVE
nr:hypothetical protein CFP56_52448 [Quercus suber]